MTLLNEIEKRQQTQTTESKANAKSKDAAQKESEKTLEEGNAEAGYAVLVAIALFLVHTTLSILARVQYGQDINILLVLCDSIRAFPVFLMLVYLFHPFASMLFKLVGFVASNACGCYIVYLFNTEGYYASMSRVPSIGTIWIWLFIELDWYYGLATLGIVGAYIYSQDFSLI